MPQQGLFMLMLATGLRRAEVLRLKAAAVNIDEGFISSSKKIAKRMPLQDAVRLTSDYLRTALLKVLELPGRFEPYKLEADLLSRKSGLP
jgi:integrase